MLSFDNTEVAFSGKTNSELKWAHRLFKLIGNNTLISLGKTFTNIALKLHLPISGIVKRTVFKQFCGGESIEECKDTINRLADNNIGTILDYSVEAKSSDSDLEDTCLELERGIKLAGKNIEIPFVVFKISGIAPLAVLQEFNEKEAVNSKEYDKAYAKVDRLCKAAKEANKPIFIDAEESWIQGTIDRIVEEMMQKYNKEKAVVYNTAQLYRWDRLDYIKNLYKKSKENGFEIGLKLVRGAYMEKERDRAKDNGYPSPIQKDKEATDRDYDLALEFCVANNIACCVGTHNEESSLLMTQLMEKAGAEKNNSLFYFSQLLGMSDHISFNLSNNGYNVAKYVPYGPVKEVIPYLIRRAEENTSVAGQTSRELSLISHEITRRSLLKQK